VIGASNAPKGYALVDEETRIGTTLDRGPLSYRRRVAWVAGDEFRACTAGAGVVR